MTQPDAPIELDIIAETPTLDVVSDSVVELTPAPDVSVDLVETPTTLEAAPEQTVVELEQRPVELDLASPGPAGAPGRDGTDGAPGTPGPPGSLDNASYTWQQNSPENIWVVSHNLGYHPAVTVVDSGGTTVEGGVTYVDVNTVELHFDAPFGGVAYLS